MTIETLLSVIAVLVALILVVEIFRGFADHKIILAAKDLLQAMENRTKVMANQKDSAHENIAELIDSEKLEDALQQIHMKLQSRPNDARLYWLKGRALYLMGEKRGSESAFQHTQELEPGYSESVRPYLEQLGKNGTEGT